MLLRKVRAFHICCQFKLYLLVFDKKTFGSSTLSQQRFSLKNIKKIKFKDLNSKISSQTSAVRTVGFRLLRNQSKCSILVDGRPTKQAMAKRDEPELVFKMAAVYQDS